MSKLIGRRVVVKGAGFGAQDLEGMVGTIVEVDRERARYPVKLTFYCHDIRPCFNASELRYLNGKQVKL